MSLHLERDKYHSRTLKLTGNDMLDEITIDYTPNGNAYKGAAIDGEVIPAIIRAVNFHDQLVEALKEILRHINEEPVDEGYIHQTIRNALKNARDDA